MQLKRQTHSLKHRNMLFPRTPVFKQELKPEAKEINHAWSNFRHQQQYSEGEGMEPRKAPCHHPLFAIMTTHSANKA